MCCRGCCWSAPFATPLQHLTEPSPSPALNLHHITSHDQSLKGIYMPNRAHTPTSHRGGATQPHRRRSSSHSAPHPPPPPSVPLRLSDRPTDPLRRAHAGLPKAVAPEPALCHAGNSPDLYRRDTMQPTGGKARAPGACNKRLSLEAITRQV